MQQLVVILVLAVVQGITEFLPISSDGHLVLVQSALAASGTELANPLGVTILLHAGTLLAILVYFRRRIWRLVSQDRRTLGLLAVGTLPAVVVGLVAKRYLSEWLVSLPLTGASLLANGLLLLITPRISVGEDEYNPMSHAKALAIGLAQALAILPGLSRSGTTIVTGLCLGLRRDAAATFSFLLAIPVIAGANVLELADMARAGEAGASPAALALGAAVSFLVGLAALSWLLKWPQQGRLHYFGYWCLALGFAALAWSLAR